MFSSSVPNITDETKFDDENRPWRKLDLYNFEEPEAVHSAYILTSPRSLKACRLADLKPIELLRQTSSDIALELNLPETKVAHIYADRERERLRKLEVCRLIRKHMIKADSRRSQQLTNMLNENHNVVLMENIRNSPTIVTTGDIENNVGDIFQYPKRSQSCSPCSTIAEPVRRDVSLRFRKKNCDDLSNEKTTVPGRSNYKERLSKSAENTRKNTNPKTITMPKLKPNFRDKSQSTISRPKINDRQLCWQIDRVHRADDDETSKKLRMNQKTRKKKELVKKPNNDRKSSPTLNQREFAAEKRKAVVLDKNESNCAKISLRKFDEKSRKDVDDVKARIDAKSKGTNAIKDHDVRILEAMVSKKEMQHSRDNFARRASKIRRILDDELLVPTIGATQPRDPNYKKSKTNNLDCHCSYDEYFPFDSYFQQIRDRMKQLKENSFYKELHSEHVRQLARELQIGMEQWQDQVLLLQWQALQRARTNAKLYLENKKLKTQSENTECALLHALRFRNVQDIERIRRRIIKKEIEDKDSKIENLKMKREREILDCRAQAKYTAGLREQLRRTLTPETFDRKVNDAMIKTKFINRSLTASPLTESHIRLG